MKKLFLIVLYKCRIEDSRTCQFIKEQQMMKYDNNTIFIWDNSPDYVNNSVQVKNYFASENIVFIHTPENTSLSKIYNTILDNYCSYDAIQIFDQDSYIEKENYNTYIDNLIKQESKINIFFPKIYSQGILYSPGKLLFFKGKHFSNLKNGINKCKSYTAIGSGILFRPKYCIDNNVKFSEKLHLYSVDTDFTYKMSRLSPYFYVMDLKFLHDLSENKLTKEQRKNRRKIQLDGLLIVYCNDPIKKAITRLYIMIIKILRKI